MEKRLYGIRGAVCTENNAESIIQNVCELCSNIFNKNKICAEDIVSIQFSVTSDIDALNPASALRKGNAGIDVSHCPLFCCQEPKMSTGLDHVVRVLITSYMVNGSKPEYVYLNGAQALRPDLSKEKK